MKGFLGQKVWGQFLKRNLLFLRIPRPSRNTDLASVETQDVDPVETQEQDPVEIQELDAVETQNTDAVETQDQAQVEIWKNCDENGGLRPSFFGTDLEKHFLRP